MNTEKTDKLTLGKSSPSKTGRTQESVGQLIRALQEVTQSWEGTQLVLHVFLLAGCFCCCQEKKTINSQKDAEGTADRQDGVCPSSLLLPSILPLVPPQAEPRKRQSSINSNSTGRQFDDLIRHCWTIENYFFIIFQLFISGN